MALWCRYNRHPSPEPCEATIRTFVVSLIGAAAVAAGLVILRQQKDPGIFMAEVPPGESVPATLVLERIRSAGI